MKNTLIWNTHTLQTLNNFCKIRFIFGLRYFLPQFYIFLDFISMLLRKYSSLFKKTADKWFFLFCCLLPNISLIHVDFFETWFLWFFYGSFMNRWRAKRALRLRRAQLAKVHGTLLQRCLSLKQSLALCLTGSWVFRLGLTLWLFLCSGERSETEHKNNHGVKPDLNSQLPVKHKAKLCEANPWPCLNLFDKTS